MEEFIILCIGIISFVLPILFGVILGIKLKNFLKINKSIREGSKEYKDVNIQSKFVGVVVTGMLFVMTLAFFITLLVMYIMTV